MLRVEYPEGETTADAVMAYVDALLEAGCSNAGDENFPKLPGKDVDTVGFSDCRKIGHKFVGDPK